MNKLLSITVLFLSGMAYCFAADSYVSQWQKGNAFYAQKQYDSALYYYEQIAAQKPRNADIYYNIGNTYYRLNKVALAILNYQRALAVNPEYTAAKDNLLLAQSRINNVIAPVRDIFFIRWWRSLTQPNKANGLAVISLALFILLVLSLLSNRIRKAGSKHMPPQVNGFLFFVFLCFITLAVISAQNAAAHDSAVVMQADVPLMNGELKGKPLALVPEGTTVHIKEQKGDWVKVSLPDGRSGWIQIAGIDKI